MVAPAHTGTATPTPPLHFLAISPWPAQLGKWLAFVVAFRHPLRGQEPLGDLASNSAMVITGAGQGIYQGQVA